MNQDSNNYWEQLERLEKLIRASELKAGIIFSFHSLILGIFVEKLTYLQELFNGSAVFIVLTSLWILCVFLSIFYCFKCFNPQIESKYSKNVFFFRDAVYAFGNTKSYSKKLMEVCNDPEELFEMLSEQVHVESVIIDAKFKSVLSSIKFFAFSFVFVALTIFYYLITLL